MFLHLTFSIFVKALNPEPLPFQRPQDPLMEATQGEGEDTQAGEESEGDEEEEEEEERDGAHEGHDETKSQPPNPPEPSSHGSQLVLDEPSHDPSQLGVNDLVESPVDSPLPCKKLFHEEDHEDVHTNTFEMNSVSLDEPMTEEQRSEQIAALKAKLDAARKTCTAMLLENCFSNGLELSPKQMQGKPYLCG